MENQRTDEHRRESRGSSVALGVVVGTVVGVGLGMWLGPRLAVAFRRQLDDWSKIVRDGVSEQYRQANTRTGEAIDHLTRVGRDVRDEVADAVVHGAQKVERLAASVKTGADR